MSEGTGEGSRANRHCRRFWGFGSKWSANMESLAYCRRVASWVASPSGGDAPSQVAAADALAMAMQQSKQPHAPTRMAARGGQRALEWQRAEKGC